MLSSSKRATLIGTVAVLLVAVAALQNHIDPLRRQKAIEPQDARGVRGAGKT